ncbi:hypothetical protein CNMCM5878_003916 [Aspergillus fumigatiaffinis]|nr:hypothetical protein CNMCM5878_003916 [Aspergillus fumigatiaffinis]
MDHPKLSFADVASVNPISNSLPATPMYQVRSVLGKRRQSELKDTDAAMLPPDHSREGEADSYYIGTEVLSRNMPSFQCIQFAENGPDRCGPDNTCEVQPGGRINCNLMATGDTAQGWYPDRSASLPLSGSEVQSHNLQLSVPAVRQDLPDQYMRRQPISPGLSENFDTVAREEITCINPSILEKRVGEGNSAVSADGSERSGILCDIWGSSYREIPGAQISLSHEKGLPSLTIPSNLEAGGKLGSSLYPALSIRARNTSLRPDPGAGSDNLANCSSNTTHPLLISRSTSTPNRSLGPPEYAETYSRTDSCVKPLKIALMTHQVEGVTWMKTMEDSEWKGGILADDMGLGKTVQALSLVKSRTCPDARTLPTLIVTPAGLIQQWEREAENIFDSGQRVFVYYQRKGRLTFQDLCQYQVVLTTYGTICSELKQKAHDSPIFGDGKAWQRIILDEAQCIKNARSKTAMACCEVKASYRWCLSGTPLMNHLGELCSLLKFLRIQPYVSSDSFNTILKSESIGRANDAENERDMQLQGFLKTIMLRRTKATTVNGKPIVELPSVTIEDVYVAFTEEERCTYAVLESLSQRHVQRKMCSTPAPEGASTEAPMGFRCHSCRVIVDLQKVTDYNSFVRSHNFSMSDQGSSTLFPSSLKVLLRVNDEDDEDDEDDENRGSEMAVSSEACRTEQVIPPLRYRAASSAVSNAGKQSSAAPRKQVWKNHEATVVYRHALPKKWVTSSKIEKAVEVIKKIRDQGTGDKVIVFSHFTALLDLIEVPIARSGWKYRRYDRRMTPADRGSAISSFASQPDCLVMLVSLKAGNSGLNLTCASNVIIMEPSWNPYIEEQAIGRVHRIGQEKHVRVYRLLVADTIETRILELQETKRKLIRGFPNGTVMSGTDNLVPRDIAYIFVSQNRKAEKDSLLIVGLPP